MLSCSQFHDYTCEKVVYLLLSFILLQDYRQLGNIANITNEYPGSNFRVLLKHLTFV